jgi:hypothetical protein
MYSFRNRSLLRARPVGLVATAALALALTVFAAPVAAHDDEHEAPASKAPPNCTEAEKKKLAKAKDNFSEACAPDKNLAQMNDSAADLPVGEQAAEDIELLTNLPKNGAFEAETAFNSDLAFSGKYAYAGNYEGFTVYDLSNPEAPEQVAQVVCPGSQNDVSVYKDVLVLSTDSSRNNNTCTNTAQPATEKSSWEGLKVFDISDPTNPQYIAAVETPCGSHTHTLAPSKGGKNLWVYVSSYFPSATFPDCQPPHDLISVVKVSMDKPETAKLIDTPVLFPDGGNPAGNYSRETSGCHDITAYPEKDIAAGACMGDGILMDISDRQNPVVTEQTRDTENFAFWHSATFNNAGTKVVYTDELGGGGAATCNPTIGPNKGANGIYDIQGGELAFKSYYKIPRTNSNTENCVAHNGSLIPVAGKDIMVQAWYQGGISVMDFTDSANPEEIAWFDRGPLSDERLILGGSWSAYYYNGYVYSNDIQKGFDVLKVTDPAAQSNVTMDSLNPQSQPSY